MILRRLNIPVHLWAKPDDSWRKWAYDEGVKLGVSGLTDVTLTFQPLAAHRRNVQCAPNYWPTVEYVIDGLIGARVFASRDPKALSMVTLSPSDVVGVNGLEVQILTAADLAPPPDLAAQCGRNVRFLSMTNR